MKYNIENYLYMYINSYSFYNMLDYILSNKSGYIEEISSVKIIDYFNSNLEYPVT